MRWLCFSSLLLLLAGALGAQTGLLTGPNRTYHTKVGPQTIVRDAGGNLYVVYQHLVSPTNNDISIGRSTDGGKTWNMKWQTGFALNPVPTDLGNFCPALAIDGNGNLHCAWYHDVASARRTIRYNRYDAGTMTWGQEVFISPQNSPYKARAYTVLEVDSRNYVWLLHGGSSSWRCEMKRSDLPFASDMKFSPSVPPFNTSEYGNQEPEFVIDAADRLHVTYYCYGGSDRICHRWMDPAAANPVWSPLTSLADSSPINDTADYYSSMAADLMGNVYVVYGRDVQCGSNKIEDPEWFLRKWDNASQTWSNALSFYKTTRKQWDFGGKYNDGSVISAACDETTGEFYFTYRNVDTGNFVLARWCDGNQAPTTHAVLMNTGSLAPNTSNYFLYPQIRGSLFPTFNRFSAGIDILYTVGDQLATSPSYILYYDSLTGSGSCPVASLSNTAAPKIGTTFDLNLLSVKEPGKAYLMAMSMAGTTPGIPVDRRFIPLVPDSMFYLSALGILPSVFQKFQGVLDASGAARAGLAIPNNPALVAVTFHNAFVTYPGPLGVNAISNPLTITIEK
jgi:hypothetical protein